MCADKIHIKNPNSGTRSIRVYTDLDPYDAPTDNLPLEDTQNVFDVLLDGLENQSPLFGTSKYLNPGDDFASGQVVEINTVTQEIDGLADDASEVIALLTDAHFDDSGSRFQKLVFLSALVKPINPLLVLTAYENGDFFYLDALTGNITDLANGNSPIGQVIAKTDSIVAFWGRLNVNKGQGTLENIVRNSSFENIIDLSTDGGTDRPAQTNPTLYYFDGAVPIVAANRDLGKYQPWPLILHAKNYRKNKFPDCSTGSCADIEYFFDGTGVTTSHKRVSPRFCFEADPGFVPDPIGVAEREAVISVASPFNDNIASDGRGTNPLGRNCFVPSGFITLSCKMRITEASVSNSSTIQLQFQKIDLSDALEYTDSYVTTKDFTNLSSPSLSSFIDGADNGMYKTMIATFFLEKGYYFPRIRLLIDKGDAGRFYFDEIKVEYSSSFTGYKESRDEIDDVNFYALSAPLLTPHGGIPGLIDSSNLFIDTLSGANFPQAGPIVITGHIDNFSDICDLTPATVVFDGVDGTTIFSEVITTGGGAGGIKPGTVVIDWEETAVAKQATDDGVGNLTGDVVSGTVDYDTGAVDFVTNTNIDNDGIDTSEDVRIVYDQDRANIQLDIQTQDLGIDPVEVDIQTITLQYLDDSGSNFFRSDGTWSLDLATFALFSYPFGQSPHFFLARLTNTDTTESTDWKDINFNTLDPAGTFGFLEAPPFGAKLNNTPVITFTESTAFVAKTFAIAVGNIDATQVSFDIGTIGVGDPVEDDFYLIDSEVMRVVSYAGTLLTVGDRTAVINNLGTTNAAHLLAAAGTQQEVYNGHLKQGRHHKWLAAPLSLGTTAIWMTNNTSSLIPIQYYQIEDEIITGATGGSQFDQYQTTAIVRAQLGTVEVAHDFGVPLIPLYVLDSNPDAAVATMTFTYVGHLVDGDYMDIDGSVYKIATGGISGLVVTFEVLTAAPGNRKAFFGTTAAIHTSGDLAKISEVDPFIPETFTASPQREFDFSNVGDVANTIENISLGTSWLFGDDNVRTYYVHRHDFVIDDSPLDIRSFFLTNNNARILPVATQSGGIGNRLFFAPNKFVDYDRSAVARFSKVPVGYAFTYVEHQAPISPPGGKPQLVSSLFDGMYDDLNGNDRDTADINDMLLRAANTEKVNASTERAQYRIYRETAPATYTEETAGLTDFDTDNVFPATDYLTYADMEKTGITELGTANSPDGVLTKYLIEVYTKTDHITGNPQELTGASILHVDRRSAPGFVVITPRFKVLSSMPFGGGFRLDLSVELTVTFTNLSENPVVNVLINPNSLKAVSCHIIAEAAYINFPSFVGIGRLNYSWYLQNEPAEWVTGVTIKAELENIFSTTATPSTLDIDVGVGYLNRSYARQVETFSEDTGITGPYSCTLIP